MEQIEQFENISREEEYKPAIEVKRSLDGKIKQIDELIGFFEYFKKSVRDVMPEKQDFNIELKKDDNGNYSIFLQKDGDEVKDLSSYLPEGYKFKTGEQFSCDYEKKEIIFKEEEIKLRGFLISLFHEIGHANKKTPELSKEEESEFLFHLIDGILNTEMFTLYLTGKTSINDRSKKISIDDLSKLSKKEITIDELLGEGKREEFINKELSNMTDAQVEEFLLKWFIETKGPHQFQAQSERNAWASSLWRLRQLQKEGYDVFSGFNNIEEIKMYILYCLLTYDFSFGKQGNKLLFSKLNPQMSDKLIEPYFKKLQEK